jgi:CheY-like chemotaxis protein
LASALELLSTSQYDAVVTDYRLDEYDPRKTGLVVIERARAKDKHCICILMTAYPEDFDRYKDAFSRGGVRMHS